MQETLQVFAEAERPGHERSDIQPSSHYRCERLPAEGGSSGGDLRLCVLRILVVGCFLPALAHAEARRVETAPIKRAVVHHEIRTFGVLAPRVEELSFQVRGRIRNFVAAEGDRVEAGQVLAELEIQDAEYALRGAASERDNGLRLLERMKALHAERSVQTAELEDAQARYEQLQVAYEQAEFNVAQCKLRAPSSGLILKKVTDSRTSVAPGQTIFVFQSDREEWITKVDLTDRNALLVADGAEANIRFAPYPGKTFKGRVTSVAQLANPADGLFTAEIAISTQGAALRPGMVAEVDLMKATDRPYTILPFDALLDLRGNRGVVYLVDDEGRAVEKAVTIYALERDTVAVIEDLGPYREVVVRGHYGLSHHMPVVVSN